MPRRLRWRSLVRISALLVILISIIDAYSTHNTYTRNAGQKTPQQIEAQRVFIASIHWNNEAILRSHWNQALINLVEHFGRDNVFVSIQESGSWDNTKGVLRQLDQQLDDRGIQRRVVLDETTHLDEISRPPASRGWIDTPRGKRELRRIPYLARLRNLVLEPLAELAAKGYRFDKIIFLNDVIFTNRDIDLLMNTRDGDYAAACALDFSTTPMFYDTFALRDFEGHEMLMQDWPYFRARASRHALKAGLPVPVSSCWNGIAIMDARPFYDDKPPLRFRGIPDSLAQRHVEGSECCLIHADNALSGKLGVWLNPNVRVAYNGGAYAIVNPSSGHSWLSFTGIYWSLWRNRLLRWFTTSYLKESVIRRRVQSWKSDSPDRQEVGIHCLINEMQVLVENGWAHV